MSEAFVSYCNIGPFPGYVGFTTSAKAFQREVKRLKVPEPPKFLASDRANATTHFLEKDGATTAIITIGKPKGVSFEQYAGLIAHEAVHVAQMLWSDIGEKAPGDEAEAYLVQHIVQFCLQEAYKTGRERRLIPQ